MTVKDLFSKEFLFESVKKEKYPYKIFYKLDIFLKKKKAEELPAEQPAPVQEVPQAPVTQEFPQQPVQEVPPTPEVPQTAPAPEAGQNNIDMSYFSSVVTEDDKEEDEEVTDDNVIVRKLHGEIILTKEEVNNIQAIDDIYQKLQEEKDNGANILDDLSFELLQNLTATNQLQQELKDKVDIKESSIFAEIIYGKKPEDSVGVRLIKRKGSELVTNSMLIDNQIVNFQFSKEKLDSKIVDMRNEEYSDEKQNN